ncbi:CDP-archaeol synthase [Candidatus Tiddalikarchaeum anstoanum]|nr:CDP-archaeol synthase [Candidatus Tiddalikarchaeum anstoanum]
MILADIIVQTLQILIPAYIANGSPPFLIRMPFKKHPLDFGLKIGKNRVFGDGKTIEGLILASIMGYLMGLLVTYFISILPSTITALSLPPLSYLFIGLGAMIGDLIGSFYKRRMGLPRGANMGLLDMEDFIIGSLIAVRFYTPYSWYIVIIALVLTPIVHRAANIIGYKIGVKREPW